MVIFHSYVKLPEGTSGYFRSIEWLLSYVKLPEGTSGYFRSIEWLLS